MRERLSGRNEVEVGVSRVETVGGQGDDRVRVLDIGAVSTQVGVVLQVPGVDVVAGGGVPGVPRVSGVSGAGGRCPGAVHGADPPVGGDPVGRG